ncbi:hypothetical protein STEG23_030068 [Scotinomys teguina]
MQGLQGTVYMLSVYRGQKKVSDLLELELSHHVNARKKPNPVFCENKTVTACKADRHNRACSFTGFSDSFWSVKRPALATGRQDSRCLPPLGTFSLRLSLSGLRASYDDVLYASSYMSVADRKTSKGSKQDENLFSA